MGIARTVQWAKHNTTAELTEHFGMREPIGHLLGQCRLRWLGHLARMSDSCIPKRLCLVGCYRSVLLMVLSFIGGIRSDKT